MQTQSLCLMHASCMTTLPMGQKTHLFTCFIGLSGAFLCLDWGLCPDFSSTTANLRNLLFDDIGYQCLFSSSSSWELQNRHRNYNYIFTIKMCYDHTPEPPVQLMTCTITHHASHGLGKQFCLAYSGNTGCLSTPTFFQTLETIFETMFLTNVGSSEI